MRASATLKIETLTEYFELYNSLRQEHKIRVKDTYNMDEKDFYMGTVQRAHMLISIAEKEIFLRQDSNREWISVIKIISASNESLPSYIIFKAAYQ